MNNDKSCTVALHRECNSAIPPQHNATRDTTIMQPLDLMTLAVRVLQRQTCNPSRNFGATDRLHGAQLDATSNQINATSKVGLILQKYALTLQEIQEVIGDDLHAYAHNSEAMEALAILIINTRARQQGKLPPTYTAIANCYHCGDVWLPPELACASPLLGCPWCANTARGLPIPRPSTHQRAIL